jgi:hypothetical protein
VSYYLGYGHGVCPSSPPGVLLELTNLRLSCLGLSEQDFTHLASRVALLVEQEGWMALADEVSN